jgi:hypothetical protein
MSLSERPERKSSISEATGYAVLVAIAAGFFALHILAGQIIPRAPESASTTTAPRMWED